MAHCQTVYLKCTRHCIALIGENLVIGIYPPSIAYNLASSGNEISLMCCFRAFTMDKYVILKHQNLNKSVRREFMERFI